MPKLFIYLSGDGSKAVVLFRKTKSTWLQCWWDLITDEITEGQWLTKKSVHTKGTVLSPDGTKFMYQYTDQEGDHVCVSKPPYFSAHIHGFTVGRWFDSNFTVDNVPVFDHDTRDIKNNLPMEYEIAEKFILQQDQQEKYMYSKQQSKQQYTRISKSGRLQPPEWNDVRGRSIKTVNGVLYINEVEINFMEKKFKNVSINV